MGPLDLKQILEVKKGDDETISTKRWNYLTAGNREIIIHREIIFKKKKEKKKKLYGSFVWMGFSCLETTEPIRRGNSLFTTKSPGVLGTYLIDPWSYNNNCIKMFLSFKLKFSEYFYIKWTAKYMRNFYKIQCLFSLSRPMIKN